MREIKFRGLTRTGRWVYGSLVIDQGETYIYWRDDAGLHKSVVLPETVGQYTGLKDHVHEWYEDDVIEQEGTGRIAVIEFEDGAFWAVENGVRGGLLQYWQAEFRVIGNVYENPELLENHI